MPTPNPPNPRVRFDGTINLGHILTFLGMLISGFVAWSAMDKRVVVLEEARVYQKAVDMRQDEERGQIKQQVREDYKDISNKLDRVLDLTLYKPKGK
jgi:hypothetical protein